MSTIYLAGGCFWGLQSFFDQFEGVIRTEVGYANGPEQAPSYEDVCRDSGHAETVKIVYDEEKIPLEKLLDHYFMVIDPLSVNRQGHDEGIQYRTGIFFTEESQRPAVTAVYAREEEKAGKKLAVAVEPLKNFFPAEEYHQKYLEKNPGGYCHIPAKYYSFGSRHAYTLNDGFRIPQIGFGTYKITSTAPILSAVEAGYRFFDTASLYETERLLGSALRESGLAREDYIIETKLWIDEMDDPAAALERSLKRLGTDYVDIFMIHWPRETGTPDERWRERDLETYRGMENLVEAGKVRRLGLSNFLPHHLLNILDNCDIKPVVNQLELHPGYSQEAAVHCCREHGVLPMAWSPFGRGQSAEVLGNRMVRLLAEKYGKSPQQIALRFLLQKGILPIPKAAGSDHIRANTDVFDFSLTEEEISLLTYMPQTTWLGEHPDFAIPTARSNPRNI